MAFEAANDLSDGNEIKARVISTIADIEIQQLNWQAALDNYKILKEIDPFNIQVWKKVISLKLRLGLREDAQKELDACLSIIVWENEREKLRFISECADDNQDFYYARIKLADELQEQGLQKNAIEELDKVIKAGLEVRKKEIAISALQRIIKINPSNVKRYQDLLDELS